jgi:hypothetical protein
MLARSKMTGSRIIILAFIISTVFTGYLFGFSNEIRNFCLATGVLGFEVVDFFTFRRRSNHTFVFKVWSTQWMFGIGFAFLLIYFFSDDLMNIWNVCAIGEIVVYATLYVARNRFSVYVCEQNGIRNLNNGEVLDSSTITAIKVDDKSIVIDTTKYQNDLVVKADILHTPTWDELVSHIPKMKGQQD